MAHLEDVINGVVVEAVADMVHHVDAVEISKTTSQKLIVLLLILFLAVNQICALMIGKYNYLSFRSENNLTVFYLVNLAHKAIEFVLFADMGLLLEQNID